MSASNDPGAVTRAAFDPTPRPALRRAADAGTHPTAPVPAGPASAASAASAAETVREGAKPRKHKLVKLKVEVPKSLKEDLVDEARRRGMSLDELVSLVLRSRGA